MEDSEKTLINMINHQAQIRKLYLEMEAKIG